MFVGELRQLLWSVGRFKIKTNGISNLNINCEKDEIKITSL